MSEVERYAITINVVKLNEEGDDIGEYSGITMDMATTDADVLEEIKGKLFDTAVRYFDSMVPTDTVSSRRPFVEDSEWLEKWLEIGLRNPWIREAYDPPFDERSFMGFSEPENLAQWLTRDTRWSLGVAFFWDDQCWINQIDGGSEFMVIKQDVSFESISVRAMEEDEPGSVLTTIVAIANSTPEECLRLEYMQNEEGIRLEHTQSAEVEGA